MRISAKGRYALAAMINMAQNYSNDGYTTLLSISDKLNISKIYLEQVFFLLKKSGLVTSIKGAQGGYKLQRNPLEITAYDILLPIESALFEKTKETVDTTFPNLELSLQLSVFSVLDDKIKDTLSKITLLNLVKETEKHQTDKGYMFYI
ncbi:MAG: RrF2 family transcriptional regulator [Eubacteriaceae bacterium]